MVCRKELSEVHNTKVSITTATDTLPTYLKQGSQTSARLFSLIPSCYTI